VTEIEFLFALLVLVAVLVRVAGAIRIPYPILVVAGGLGLGFVPGLPEIELEPDVVFLVFLPPLLYSAAFFSSPRELRAYVGPISRLAVGLVLVTIVVVALASRLLLDLPWPVAFVLGAILAPTDPVAAIAVFARLGVPQRARTIIEGESLINDSTGLVALSVALGAVGGSFSLGGAALEFVLVSAGGVAIGLALGWVVAHVRRRLDDPPVEITISLLTPYAAYLPAEELGVSGVLATVTVGLYMGWQSPGLFLAGTRLQAFAFWNVLAFLLNSLLFILIGLQAPRLLEDVSGSPGTAIAVAGAIVVVLIAVRMLWMFTVPGLVRVASSAVGSESLVQSPRERVLIGASGMRGAISVAAALSIPLEAEGGGAFPERDLVILVAFCVVVATLVLQGVSLPGLAHLLGLTEPRSDPEGEARTRAEVARAALSRLDEIALEEDLEEETEGRIRAVYESRLDRLRHRAEHGDHHEGGPAVYERVRRELITAERSAVHRMHEAGEISHEETRSLERDLDLEESRLEG